MILFCFTNTGNRMNNAEDYEKPRKVNPDIPIRRFRQRFPQSRKPDISKCQQLRRHICNHIPAS